MTRSECQFAHAVFRGVGMLVALVALTVVSMPAQAPSTVPAVAASPHKAVTPAQPVPFSHKLHLGVGLECQTCHTNASPGAAMGLPQSSTCMQCHQSAPKDKPGLKTLAQLAKSKKPIEWKRVYVIRPNHVGDTHEKHEKGNGILWSHKTHLDAKIACQTCHGDVASLEVMAEITTATTKGGCMTCHSQRSKHPQKSSHTICSTCHKDFPHTLESDWRQVGEPSTKK